MIEERKWAKNWRRFIFALIHKNFKARPLLGFGVWESILPNELTHMIKCDKHLIDGFKNTWKKVYQQYDLLFGWSNSGEVNSLLGRFCCSWRFCCCNCYSWHWRWHRACTGYCEVVLCECWRIGKFIGFLNFWCCDLEYWGRSWGGRIGFVSTQNNGARSPCGVAFWCHDWTVFVLLFSIDRCKLGIGSEFT